MGVNSQTLRWEGTPRADVVVRVRSRVIPIRRPPPVVRAIVPIAAEKHAAHGEKSESLIISNLFKDHLIQD